MGCFSFLCSKCNDPINSDSFSGAPAPPRDPPHRWPAPCAFGQEDRAVRVPDLLRTTVPAAFLAGESCRLTLLKDGKALETMQGQYNSYGCCFKEMAAGVKQPCPVPAEASFQWEAMAWRQIVHLMNPNKYFDRDLDNGIAAYHIGCWQAELDAAAAAELPIVRRRLALASMFNDRLTELSPIRALAPELLMSIGEAVGQEVVKIETKVKLTSSGSDPDQGWGEQQHKHTSDCIALHELTPAGLVEKSGDGDTGEPGRTLSVQLALAYQQGRLTAAEYELAKQHIEDYEPLVDSVVNADGLPFTVQKDTAPPAEELSVVTSEPVDKPAITALPRSVEAKIAHAVGQKQAGNGRFKAKEYKKAIGHYLQIGLFLTGPPFGSGAGSDIGMLGGDSSQDKLTEEQQKAVDQLLVTADLNLSACYLKEEKYEKAAARASNVLLKDPDDIKALFRRGEARIYLNDLERARADLETAQELAGPAENKGITSRLSLLEKREKHFAKKEKQTYAKMFSKPVGETAGETSPAASAAAAAAVTEPPGVKAPLGGMEPMSEVLWKRRKKDQSAEATDSPISAQEAMASCQTVMIDGVLS